MLENTAKAEPVNGKPEPDLASKKKELSEAVQREMKLRAEKARIELEALCKKHRIELHAVPQLGAINGSVYGIACQVVIKPLE
jgi:hypothetical protein